MATPNNSLNNIRAWLFPGLISLLSIMIWADVKEMQSDVKQLVAQSNISTTKIENLELRIGKVEDLLFVVKGSQTYYPTRRDARQDPQYPLKKRMVAILNKEDDHKSEPAKHA